MPSSPMPSQDAADDMYESLWSAFEGIHPTQPHDGDIVVERDQLAKQLASCLELNRKILDEAPVGLLLYDYAGPCLLASAAAASILGGTKSQLLQQNFRQIPAWQEFGLLDLAEEVLVRGQTVQREFHYVSTFGKELWLDLRATPVTANSKSFLLLVIDDISKQKFAQLQLALQQAHQEELIQARTIDLQTANLQLHHEIAERKRIEEKIHYQAALLQNISDAVIATDLHFHITEWNRGAEALYGWRAEEVIGKVVDDVVRTEYIHESYEERLSSFLENGQWRGEVVQHHREGQPIQIMAAVAFIRDGTSIPIGTVAVNRDITANKHAEDKLLTLSSAVEQSPITIVITDTTGSIEYVNPKFTQLTGYTLEEVKGKNPRILKSGETSQEEYRHLWQTVMSGGQWQGQFHNRAKNGTLFWESAQISPIINSSGEITHFVAIKEDISQRKQREQEQNALLTLAMTLRSAIERDEMLPAILEQSARIADAPVAAFASYDSFTDSLTLDAVYRHGDRLYEASIPLPKDSGLSWSVLRTSEPYATEDVLADSRFAMRDLVGDERAAVCLPLAANGEPLGVLWVLRERPYAPDDIRHVSAVADMAAVALQRAKLHEKVTRYTTDLEAEVAKRTKELADANEQLKELDQLKSKFVSDVTHELRTPVTNIGLYLKLLEHKPERLADYIPILTGQAERLRTLVKDTLDISRLDHSRENLNLAPVDLNLLAQNVVAAHVARAEEQNLALEFIPAPSLPAIKGDNDKLTQVITNLVANALNYTPNGQVTVQTSFSPAERVVKCEVKDTGCGIYFDDLPHLFDRFYRGKRDQMAPVPGTGLGLSIVKEIVQLHGGQIHVSSEIGFGSTFTVCLPLPQLSSFT